MNAQNVDNKPKVQKETSKKIRVEFERTPLKERLKAKFLSLFFIKKIVWFVFRFILLLGISYIVLYPFFTWITGSFMAKEDFVNATVRLIPQNFTLDMYKAIWTELNYFKAFSNTFMLALSTALIQTFVCCFIAYGLAKFKFKGNKFVFLAVILTLVIPHQTLKQSLFQTFRYFDILGIFQFCGGGGINFFGKTITNEFLAGINIFPETSKVFSETGIQLTDTNWPLIILSLGGLAFKNGLYIFMLRQFFRGVPDELEESAYIDGSGIINTFMTIILPLSIPMMITVFLFAFSWQWTDNFYTSMTFYPKQEIKFLTSLHKSIPTSLETDYAGQTVYYDAIKHTALLMVIAPLVVLYLFCQQYLVQGIERSGLTAD